MISLDIELEVRGNLTLTGVTEVRGKHRYAYVRCSCGNEKYIRLDGILSGHVVSCGCHRNKQNAVANLKHGYGKAGEKRHPMYNTWSAMVQRCTNPKNPGYEHYGGRGITIQQSWLDFEEFRKDMEKLWFFGASLERLDTNSSYSVTNCTWVTHKEQMQNTRRNYQIRYADKDWSVKDLANNLMISEHSLRRKVNLHSDKTIDEIIESIKSGRALKIIKTTEVNKFKRYTC